MNFEAETGNTCTVRQRLEIRVQRCKYMLLFYKKVLIQSYQLFHFCKLSRGKCSQKLGTTLDYLINVHGRLLFSEKISRVDALIRWWTLINILAKFQGGRLFHCRLLIFAKLCVI